MKFLEKSLSFVGLLGLSLVTLIVSFEAERHSKNSNPSLKSSEREASFETMVNDVAFLSQGKLAERFVHAVRLRDDIKYDRVVYGSEKQGFWQGRISGSEIEFVPPTYKDLRLCYLSGDTVVHWESLKIDPPDSFLINEITAEVRGQIETPFVLLSGQSIPPNHANDQRSYLALILNSLGEVVWAHLPGNGARLTKKYMTFKAIGPGIFALLVGESESYFEVVDVRGQILKSLNPRSLEQPFVIHHDFAFSAKNEIFSLGHKVTYVRGLPTWSSRSLLRAPARLLSTPLTRISLDLQSEQVVWDPLNDFSPFVESGARSYQHLLEDLLLRQRHFTFWGKENAHIDWSHGNSIEYYPNHGVLVSLRDLNKVVLIDPKSGLMLWSLGNRESDTFQTATAEEAFYHQHNASFLPNGQILMMDNHSSPPAPNPRGSRIAIYGLDEVTGKARLAWSYTAPMEFGIPNRGSAYPLVNGDILGFFPASKNQMDHLVEIDRQNNVVRGTMEIYFADTKLNMSDRQRQMFQRNQINLPDRVKEGGGNRAVPAYTINGDRRIDGNFSCEI